VRDGSSGFVIDADAGASQSLLDGDSLALGPGTSLVLDGYRSTRRVRRAWLDTFDWRLYRVGLSLEQQAGRSGTELVLTDRDGERLASLPAPAALSWPRLVSELPPGPLRELLEPVAGIRALAPVARAASRIRERRILNADTKTVARLEIDEMSVSYPARAPAPLQVFVTAVRGYQAQADRTAAALAATAGITPSARSGLELALATAGRQPAWRPPAVQLAGGMPAATAVAAILLAQLDAAEANVPGTIRDIDTEFLHDLRIAIRRTRSVLKLAGHALPGGLAARYRPEFRWIGDLTTPTRDLDVYLLGFDDMAAGLVGATAADLDPFRDYLLRARTAAHRSLGRGLRSARFGRVASEWRAELAAVRPARKRPTAAQLAAGRIAVAQRRALRAGHRITAVSPPTDLHELRKDCKELRYLVELFGSLHDPTQRWHLIRELKALQDCLGEFQDAEVQRTELHAFADRMLAERSAPAATLLAMGEVAAGLARRQRAARMDFDGKFAAFASKANQARLAALTQAGGK
jgi:CHAD domain-containing protein